MNTISFVNANFQQGPKELNAYYLPYSVGCLWAYSKTDKSVSEFGAETLLMRSWKSYSTIKL
jgi:hypothetical protein